MWSCTSCQDTSSVILRNVRAKTLKFGRRCLNLHENTSRETGIKYVQQLYSAGPDTAYRYSVFLAGLNLSQIWAPFGQREQVLGLDTCWCWFGVGSTYDPVCFCQDKLWRTTFTLFQVLFLVLHACIGTQTWQDLGPPLDESKHTKLALFFKKNGGHELFYLVLGRDNPARSLWCE